MKKLLLVLLLVLLCPIECEATSESIGYIYIGDSRFVGMNSYLNLKDDNVFVVAKVGQGYSWFNSNALKQVKRIKKKHKKIEEWVIVTNLGVNDLYNSSK